MATLDVDGRLQIPLDEMDLSFARGSGPGGQNVNKVNSKAVVYWPVRSSPSLPEGVRQRFLTRFHRRISEDGTLVLSSDRFRDQKRNIDDCLEKLKVMILEVIDPPKPRKKTKPTRGAVERRLDAKRRTGAKKRDRRWSSD